MGTSADVGDAVREGRTEKGWTQSRLAKKAGVSRKFISDIEGGHPRAELEKTITVLSALDIHALALPSVKPERQRRHVDLDQVLRDYHG